MKRTDNPGRARGADADGGVAASRTTGSRSVGPLGFENAYALAMRRDQADRLCIDTSPTWPPTRAQLTIGGDLEFFSRPEWRAWRPPMALHFATMRAVPADLHVPRGDRRRGRCDRRPSPATAASRTTTWWCWTDPSHALPPYDAVVLLSPARAHDEKFLRALTPLVGAINLQTMQQANLMVDRQDAKRTPEEAADWIANVIRR